MFKKSFLSTCLIIALSLGLMLFSACSSTGPRPIEKLTGFVGGTTGLEINVLDGAPPTVISDAGLTPFSFVISLENAGEADVGPGTDNPFVMARLTGIMHENFGLSSSIEPAVSPRGGSLEPSIKTLDSKLTSAKRNFDDTIMPGEINYISFENLRYVPNIHESLALTLRAEVCYDYESYTTTKICMKRDVLEAWEDSSICTLRGPKPIGNSGAPIHITRVEEAPMNNDTVQINFVIEHVGTGMFFFRDEGETLLDACTYANFNPNIYKLEVFVEPIQPDLYNIECTRLDEPLPGGGAYGVVRSYEGAPLTVTCFVQRIRPVGVRVYEDMLNIKLRYRYADFLEVPILIQGHP